jgi:hypothetical protein
MRTFHTGGAVGIEKVDLMSIITSNMETQLKGLFSTNFKQVENSIVSSVDGVIIINKNEYMNPKHDIINSKDNVELAYGYFNIKLGSALFDIALDYATDVHKRHGVDEGDDTILISFKAGETIFTSKTKSTDFTQSVKVIKATLSGGKAWKNAKHFLMKIFDHYVKMTNTNADFVHFETLCCNLLRDKGNPRIAARLNRGKYNPMVGNIKDIPQLESWLSGLEFEQFNLSIQNALVYPRPEEPSVLEKVLLGDL